MKYHWACIVAAAALAVPAQSATLNFVAGTPQVIYTAARRDAGIEYLA